jgi:hypothetical protein
MTVDVDNPNLRQLEAMYKDATHHLLLAQRRGAVARRAAVDADAEVQELELDLRNIAFAMDSVRAQP